MESKEIKENGNVFPTNAKTTATTDMRQEEILKEKCGKDPGYRVPDGYFEELNACIMESLPPYPEAPKPEVLSMWQRIRPYAYLAAMFAGIWVMMKVFHTVSDTGQLSFDNPPAAIVQALESDNSEIITYFPLESDLTLEQEVSAHYDSMEDFEEDFGYELTPSYSAMTVGAAAAAQPERSSGDV